VGRYEANKPKGKYDLSKMAVLHRNVSHFDNRTGELVTSSEKFTITENCDSPLSMH
jgi:hypothetical protein